MNSLHEPSNISYTNKDFNSIYVELLEYAKKISNRWDPSASEESDPGVVLLKLCALIADKNNYNIDKNILELMPGSVTNESSARQILDQCGYAMKHYISATGTINLTLTKDLDPVENDTTQYSYILPMFTMFTDLEGSVVYSTTEEALLSVGQTTHISAVEGVSTQYTVNNDPLITLANIDNKNRLYFTELNVAENGIYITNVKSNNPSFKNYDEWIRVDNIETQPAGTRCYRFGITTDGTLCYLEFPEDVELLVEEGLNITYITTSGTDGNIAADKLKSFYIDTEVTKKANSNLSETVVSITDDDVTITNPIAIVNGRDPETVEEAYKSYQKVKDTFDTLVSLKDYTDYMITSSCASNGYVCDRTNDICDAYKILEGSDLGGAFKTLLTTETYTVEVDVNGKKEVGFVEEDSMSAFDLRVYALHYQLNPTTLEQYNKSFELSDGSKYIDFLENDSVVKSLQHNFKELRENKILLLKNKYPVVTHIIPRYTLSLSEQYSVADNVRKALYVALSSNNITFGEQAPYELILKTIESADERIKACSVAYPTYETYAIYKENNKIKELRIDDNSYGGYVEVAPYDIGVEDAIYKIQHNVMTKVKSDEQSNLRSGVTYYKKDLTLHELWKEFRSEIYAKSVLAGVTPLYTFDNTFSRGITQTNVTVYEDVKSIIAATTLTPSVQTTSDSNGNVTSSIATYGPLSEGENILLSCPSFIEENNYSSYVKFLFNLNTSVIPAKTKYQLSGDEYIIIFWKPSSDSTAYKYAKYSATSSVKIFSPSFTFDIEGNRHTDVPSGFSSLTNGTHDLYDTTLNSYVETTLTNKVTKYDILQGTQIITTYKTNKIQINQPGEKGSKYIYWALNNKDNILFKDLESIGPDGTLTQTYTLRSGEYFYYTNNSKTMLYVLGEGTKITRIGKSSTDTNGVVNNVKLSAMKTTSNVTAEEIFVKGIDVIDWYTISPCEVNDQGIPVSNSGVALFTQEMQHQLIGEGCKLDVTYSGKDYINIENSSTELVNATNIKYTDPSGNEVVLPLLEADEHWTVESILNLNMSSTRAQKLKSNQVVKITYGKNNTVVKLKDCCVLSNEDIVLSGGGDTVDNFDETVNLKLLKYTEAQSTEGSPITYNYDNFTATVKLNLTEEDEKFTFSDVDLPSFSLTKGDYLFRVTGDKELLSLIVTLTGDSATGYDVKPLLFETVQDDDGTTEITENINKVYKISVSDDTVNVKLKVTGSTIYSDTSLIIQPIFKYTSDVLDSHEDPQDSSDSFESRVLTKLHKLDKYREVDYTYTPKSYIAHPLDANMFLMKSHIYNPYTICQWKEQASDGSDIDVVNTSR